jgi:hypothetical protein
MRVLFSTSTRGAVAAGPGSSEQDEQQREQVQDGGDAEKVKPQGVV